MGVEGDEGDAGLERAGVLEEGLVAEVQAVEGADACGGAGREWDGLPQDLHGRGEASTRAALSCTVGSCVCFF